MEAAGFVIASRKRHLVFTRTGEEVRLKVAEQTRREIAGPSTPRRGMSPETQAALDKLDEVQGARMCWVGTGILSVGLCTEGGFIKFWRDDHRLLVEDRIAAIVERAQLLIRQLSEQKQQRIEAGAERAADSERQRERQQRETIEAQRVREKVAWVERHLSARRVARECREAAAEMKSLCASFEVDVIPGQDIDTQVRALLEHAERVDPLEPLRQALRENAATTNPRHCGTSDGLCSTTTR